MIDADEDGVEGTGVKRAEWTAVAGFLLSMGTAVFTGGVLYGQVQAQGSRITTLELHDSSTTAQMSDLKVSLAEIRANVQFLADRAREDRVARTGKE